MGQKNIFLGNIATISLAHVPASVMDCPGAARVGSVAKQGRRATGGAQL
jgi:hypothetical protein